MVVAAVVAVPFALIGLGASDEGDLGWAGWISVVGVLVGLVLGAVAAAREQHVGAPLTNAIVTAVGVYVLVQVIGILKRLVTDDEPALGRSTCRACCCPSWPAPSAGCWRRPGAGARRRT